MKYLDRLQPIFAVMLGLLAGLLVTAIAGENPVHVFSILVRSAFGSTYDISMTLFYATPLIFTGLSVAVAFNCGLFNIGAEGQLVFGALAAAAVGGVFPNCPWPFAPLLAGFAAFTAGAVWGVIPGWLRARRGAHEVITTIMFNFIAAGLASWVTLYLLKNPDSQNPETLTIGSGYFLHHFGFAGDAPLTSAFVLALIVVVVAWFFLSRTVIGFEIRSVGENENAARAAGVSAARARIIAMALAGGMAGLVGVGEVLGNAGRFRLGFSPEYGFIGIAVALLARNKPIGIVAAAILFGALHKGTADLDLETENVTRDLSMILQALVILSVSADGLWSWLKRSGVVKRQERL